MNPGRSTIARQTGATRALRVIRRAVLLTVLVACREPVSTGLPNCDSQPRTVVSAPYRLVVAGIDRTTSIPVGFRRQAQQEIGNYIDSLVVPGAGGAVAVTWIAANSFDPANHLTTIAVPAIRPPEYPPVPDEITNALSGRERKNHDKAIAQWCAKVEAANDTFDGELERARQSVHAQTDRIRTIDIRHEAGSDFGGFFLRAGDQIHNAPAGATAMVIVFSDLEPYGPQPKSEASLRGTSLLVRWYCLAADRCRQWQTHWNAYFSASGVADVRWLSTAEIWP